MPLVFRCMLRDGDRPAVGGESYMLGVRVPPHSNADVHPDEAGIVNVRCGGLSVNEDWRRMQFYHIPRKFESIVPGARGSNKRAIWRFGDGSFADGPFAAGLLLRVDSPNHGLVEPDIALPLHELQQRLAETREGWIELQVEEAK